MRGSRLLLLLAIAFTLTSASVASAQFAGICTLAKESMAEGVMTDGQLGLTNPDQIRVAWMALGAKEGDQVQGVFVAEDVTTSAGKKLTKYTIDTATYRAPKGADRTAVWGTFTLSRPTGGWPAGLYSLTVVLRGRQVARCPFLIK